MPGRPSRPDPTQPRAGPEGRGRSDRAFVASGSTRPLAGLVGIRGRLLIESKAKALLLAAATLDKKSEEPVLMRVQALTSFTDYFLVCTGTSSTHVQAIADGLERAASENGFHSQGVEGKGSGRWVLLDFGDVIVHVFTPDQREFYDLEGLWIDAPREPIPGVDLPRQRLAARA